MKNNSHINKMPPKIILWGGTGQAKVVRPIIEHFGSKVTAIIDDTPNLISPFEDVPVYQGYKGFEEFIKDKNKEEYGFLIAIGNRNPPIDARERLGNLLIKNGIKPITIAHHTAYIADDALIDEGTQIMAGAIIMPKAKIGKYCLINTKASIDHECQIGDHCDISPGVILAGEVKINKNVWIGSGAVVLPRITIGENSIIGAGAVVTKNIPEKVMAFGVPAKIIKSIDI